MCEDLSGQAKRNQVRELVSGCPPFDYLREAFIADWQSHMACMDDGTIHLFSTYCDVQYPPRKDGKPQSAILVRHPEEASWTFSRCLPIRYYLA